MPRSDANLAIATESAPDGIERMNKCSNGGKNGGAKGSCFLNPGVNRIWNQSGRISA